MKYDIVIVGGGMVGAAFAVALQNTSLRIALVDANISHAEDHRLIALNHSSYILFKNLNIWLTLETHASAINEVHVSRQKRFGTTRLTAKEMDVEQLGYVVPAKEINLALYAQLVKLKNVTLLRPAKLTQLSQHSEHAELTIELESKKINLQAAIVVAADGTHSTVRELLKIPTETINYQQKALVTVTELQRDHKNIAYERFLATGAIAMLPLTEQRAATIWSSDEKHIDELLKLSDADFLTLLQQQFGYRLGKFLRTQKRFSYPLTFIKAKEQIKDRVILIGNAAHTLHPIAAQGLNLALYETAIIAEHLTNHLSLENLRPYLQHTSLNVSHRLTQIFSTDFFIFNAARQAGMIGLDLCTVAKKRFGNKLLGKTEHLPKLLVS